jgi:putative ABC transport system permease protein
MMPPDFIAEFGEALSEPMTVVIDRSLAKNAGLEVGDYTEISKKRVKIVGITDGYKNDRSGFVFCSTLTFQGLNNQFRWVQYLLVKVKYSDRAEAVRDELVKYFGPRPKIKAWTKDSLFWQSQKWQLFESPNSLTFIFISLLAIFIGVAITNQSLRAAILASLKEYAALRALGVSKASLRAVIIEQAFWVGAAGILLSWILTLIFSWIAVYYRIAFSVPLWFVCASTVLLMLVALASGAMALMALYKTEPADLLR